MNVSRASSSREKMKSSDGTDRTGAPNEENHLFLTQIRFLDEQLERLQLRCDELKEQNRELVLKSKAQQKDMSDILEYLQHFLAVLEKDERELKERVKKRLQADREKTEALELLVGQEKQELQEELDRLSSERNAQAARLEDQKAHLLHLQQQIPIKAALDVKLKHLDKEHQIAVKNMYIEQNQIIDEKKQAVMSNIWQKVSAIMEEERTENGRMLEEVQSLSLKSLTLLSKKRMEQDRVRRLCRTAIKLRVLSFRIIRKIFDLKKESVKQRKRCKLLMDHVIMLQSSTESLLVYNEAYRQHLASVTQEHRQKASVAALLDGQLQDERSRTKTLEGDLRRAASVLTAIAMDSKEIPGAQLRMNRLLQVMDSREQQEAGTGLRESSWPSGAEPNPQTSASTDTEDDPLFLMAKLRPGDLSLVPGPTWKPRRAPSVSSKAPPNRVKLPPIRQSLWSTAMHKWME